MVDAEDKHLNPRKALKKMKYEENKIRVPVKNMFYKNDPPAFVTIVGSKESGKSAVLKAIVNKFTKTTIDKTDGPITITTGKDKKITFFECTNDVHQFVDTAKVSDMVIFVINAEYGIECEIMEYISLLMAHGLPKLMFVVTHVDKNNDKKLFKKIKKQVYSEVCEGLKFFYLKMYNGKYIEDEILQITRFINKMKYRPIEWKCTHPHIVIDKIDELNVYGYVRGGVINKNTDVHIPGYKDNKIENFEILNDPIFDTNKGRLSNKKNFVYAPMTYESKNEIVIKDEKIDTEIKIDNLNEVKFFKTSESKLQHEVTVEESSVSHGSSESLEVEEEEHMSSTISEECNDLESLKNLAKQKFRKEVFEESEIIEKFNKQFEEKTENSANIFLKVKQVDEQQKTINVENKLRDVAYPGEYIKINLETALDTNIDFSKILILGVCFVSEKENEIIHGKFKKNKWVTKLLKTGDPLIFSIGWRRIQSVPVYSSDISGENKMLKYCFKQGYCLINFYGIVVPPGTGYSVYSLNYKFRILGSGRVTDVTGSKPLVKKLKLVGYPAKISANTVFIKDMFTSDLEVLKFKNAKLKSVSGLKGVVKNPIGKKGDFRGAFEGEMLMSDIIFLKCFVSYPVKKICIPVEDLYNEWQGLRSLKEIRDELGIVVCDKHVEEVSSEIESCKDTRNYDLPEDIESKLPLDKRSIAVVDKRVYIPLSPEEKKEMQFKEHVEQLRKMKEKQKEIEDELNKKEMERKLGETKKEMIERRQKNIVKSSRNKRSKHRK